MATENLKQALQHAGLTAEEFADILKVDPKTVQRWVTGNHAPYPRHRKAIARALNLTEHDLWPEAQPSGQSDQDPQDGAATALSEVTGAWAHLTDNTAPDPSALITSTSDPIDLIEDEWGIELTETLADTLLQQAAAGRQIRLLTCFPTSTLDPLLTQPNIQIRFSSLPHHTLLRIGEQMLLTIQLAGELDKPPPLLQLQQTSENGLFDRLTQNFEDLWNNPEDTLSDPQQLEAYLSDQYNDDEDSSEEAADRPPAEAPPPDASEQTQRRWPRRPA